MSEIRTIPPALTHAEWNALLDHALEKPASYIIRNNAGTIQAINGTTGKIDYSGAVAQTVFDSVKAVVNAAGGGLLYVKAGAYAFNINFAGCTGVDVYGDGRRATRITGNITLENAVSCSVRHMMMIDTARTTIGLLVKAAQGEFVCDCIIDDVWLEGFSVSVDFQLSGNGWANGNIFSNLWYDCPISGQTNSVHTSSNHADNNDFINIELECDSGLSQFSYSSLTAYGIQTPIGSENSLYNVHIYDFTGPAANRFVVPSGATNTCIFGGSAAYGTPTDNGTGTYWWTADKQSAPFPSYTENTMLSWYNDAGTLRSIMGLVTGNWLVIRNPDGLINLNANPVLVDGDLNLTDNNAYGLILKDRSNGHTYRIKVTNGALGVEQVT